MTENAKTKLDTPDDCGSDFDKIMDDAALDFTDVQVRDVVDAMFEMLRERTELSGRIVDAYHACDTTAELDQVEETIEQWLEQVATKERDRLRGLWDDGIEFEDERVKEAFDVGVRLLKLYDEHVIRALRPLLERALGKDAVATEI
jgi:hypothetical protein